MITSKIYNATNSPELKLALAENMNEIVDEWWRELGKENQNAIRTFGFSHSVISSIMFFPDRSSFFTTSHLGEEYHNWKTVLKHKIDDIIEQNLANNFSSLAIGSIVFHRHFMTKVYNEVEAKIAPLELSREIEEAAIEDLLSKNEDFQFYKRLCDEEIEDLRKTMLWEAIERIKKEGE